MRSLHMAWPANCSPRCSMSPMRITGEFHMTEPTERHILAEAAPLALDKFSISAEGDEFAAWAKSRGRTPEEEMKRIADMFTTRDGVSLIQTD